MSQNFEFIRHVDIQPLLDELDVSPEWYLNTRNQIEVQRNTDAILLRKSPVIAGMNINNIQEVVDSHSSHDYPTFMEFMHSEAKRLNGLLGRALIVRLKPKSEVYPHIDAGRYYKIRDRYHLVLRSTGSFMTVEEETQEFKPGELWWFNNHKTHSAENKGDAWRIHLIYDLLPIQDRSV